MAAINWQVLGLYDIAGLMEDGTISNNLHKHQLFYYRLTKNEAMIAKLETAKKVVMLRKLAHEIEDYKLSPSYLECPVYVGK